MILKEDDMLEILEFVFQDFWHWLGTVVLVMVFPVPFAKTVVGMIRAKEVNHKKERNNDKVRENDRV